MNKLAMVALGVLMLAGPASAQDKPVSFNIGGGFTTPMGDISDRFGTGTNFSIGLVIRANNVFAIQPEYTFNRLSGEDATIPGFPTPVGGISTSNILLQSHHTMHLVGANVILSPNIASAVKPYFIGGAGAYYRNVNITTPDTGFATVCDPYWFYCGTAIVSVDQIVGERSTWDPGFNVGGGVTIALGESAQFYVEARYHYMTGPEFTNRDGETVDATGTYLPVTFGFRF